MRHRVLCLVALLTATASLAAQNSSRPDPEVAKRIAALQAQIEELRKQQEALLKEQERAEKEQEAAKANQFARVELRGKLVRTPGGTRINERNEKVSLDRWHIAVNRMPVPVRFNKALLELAEQYDGKEVLVSGYLESSRATFQVVKHDLFQLHPPPNRVEVEDRVVVISEVVARSLKLAEEPKP
jgi:hypothetical protein